MREEGAGRKEGKRCEELSKRKVKTARKRAVKRLARNKCKKEGKERDTGKQRKRRKERVGEMKGTC